MYKIIILIIFFNGRKYCKALFKLIHMPFTFVQGFFRRSIVKVQQNKESYKCVGKGEGCILGPGKRNPCAACRYARCLDVGMSIGGTYDVFVDWLFCFTPYRQFSIHKTAACVWGQMYLLYVTFTWLLILSIVPSCFR